jgi:hypothetical protein
MKRILIALLTALLLLPASRCWAQPDLELYSAEVCNKGQITVDVGVAYKDFGFSDEFWVIDGWYDVPRGTCKTVFAHSYAKQDRNWLGFRSFPVHLAFAFTDSTGVWGAARVNPPPGIARSRLQLCVTKKNFEYRVDAKDPATTCKGKANAMLIAASIDFEPTAGDYYDYVGRQYGRPSMSATVALGANDRSIPLGPQVSLGGAAQGPGTSDEFTRLLTLALNAPESTFGPGGYELKPGYRWVNICASRQVVSRESLSDLSTARARAITHAARQFLAAHGKGKTGFRVMELNGGIALEPFDGKADDCLGRGDLQYRFQSAELGR